MGPKKAAAKAGDDDRDYAEENKLLEKKLEVLQYRMSIIYKVKRL